jgi:hypothetical protein
MEVPNERKILMNAVQKRLSVVGLTVVLILLASVSLYGQVAPGQRYVFYVDPSSDVHELSATASGSAWSDSDLTTLTGAPVAASGSALSTVDDVLHYVHVFYLDASGRIWELYQTGTSSWSYRSPSSLTGAPAAVAGSALTSLVDSSSGGNVIHVFYLGTNEDVYELYYSGAWYSDAPAALAGAGAAAAGSALTSLIDLSNGSNIIHVFFVGTNRDVYELYRTGTSWHCDDVTSLAGAPLAASIDSSVTSFIDNSGGTASIMHVFYMGPDEDVYEMYYTGHWHSDDPTSLAGAPVADNYSPLTGFINTSGSGDTGMHLMYLSANNVYALHWGSSWSYFDATVSGGAPLAASGKPLASLRDSVTGGVRLYFIVTGSRHIYELYWPSEGAVSGTDLTAASGAKKAAAGGSGLSGVMQPNY